MYLSPYKLSIWLLLCWIFFGSCFYVTNVTSHVFFSLFFPSHNWSFANRVMKRVAKVKKSFLLICGDFNLVPDRNLDSTSLSISCHSSLQPTITNHALFDTWRCLHVDERDDTYFSTAHNVYTRIDLILVDRATLSLLQSVFLGWIVHRFWHVYNLFTLTYVWRNDLYIMQKPGHVDLIKKHLQDFFFTLMRV